MNHRTRNLIDRLIASGEDVETFPDEELFIWRWMHRSGGVAATYRFTDRPGEEPKLIDVQFIQPPKDTE